MKKLVASLALLMLVSPAVGHDVPTKAKSPKVAQPTKHSGGTDAQGCHTNHQTGVYHCHKPK